MKCFNNYTYQLPTNFVVLYNRVVFDIFVFSPVFLFDFVGGTYSTYDWKASDIVLVSIIVYQ